MSQVEVKAIAHILPGGTYYTIDDVVVAFGTTIPLTSLGSYARGRIIRGGAANWEAYAAETDGAILIGDGTDIVSDTTPSIAGLVTLRAGFVLTGGTGDLNGVDLILDGDGDSYLHASADDVVDLVLAGASGEFGITINGAEDFTFTANSFNVPSGSVITMADDTTIGLSGGGHLAFDSTPAPDQIDVTDADLYFATASHGIIHVDGNTAGWILRSDGTRYVPANPATTSPIAPVAQGDLIIADATPEWSILTLGAAAGYALVSTATTAEWDQTPTWSGLHTFSAGITFSGASGANNITIPDNVAIAVELLDAGGLEYLRIVSTDAQPIILFNEAGADVDFHVEASGVADALQIQGSDGQITLGVLGAGVVQSSAGGVLSSAALPLTDLASYAEGSLIIGGAADWEALATAGGAGYALVSDGTTAAWDQTPTWTGLHTFNVGAHILDDQTLIFGTNSDGTIEYDENGTDQVRVAGADWAFEPNLYLAEYIYHLGDVDTSIRFQADQITIAAGGVDLIDIVEGASDYVQFPTKIGVGTTRTDGTAHIHTASAGAVSAITGADELVIENSGSTGISILGPDASNLNLVFGSPSDSQGAIIRWNHDAALFQVGSANAGAEFALLYANSAEGARIDSTGRFGVGISAAIAAKAHIDQSSAAGAIPVLFLDQGDTSEECIKFSSDATDRDINLWTVNVTGGPTFFWDESGDAYSTNKGLILTAGDIVMPDGGQIGQAAGPLMTFDDSNNYLEITGANVGIGTAIPRGIANALDDPGGFLWYTNEATFAAETNVIPAGAADSVTYTLGYTCMVRDAGGTIEHDSGTIDTPLAASTSVDIFDDASEVLRLRLYSTGQVTLTSTGNATTFQINLRLFWLF